MLFSIKILIWGQSVHFLSYDRANFTKFHKKFSQKIVKNFFAQSVLKIETLGWNQKIDKIQ